MTVAESWFLSPTRGCRSCWDATGKLRLCKSTDGFQFSSVVPQGCSPLPGRKHRCKDRQQSVLLLSDGLPFLHSVRSLVACCQNRVHLSQWENMAVLYKAARAVNLTGSQMHFFFSSQSSVSVRHPPIHTSLMTQTRLPHPAFQSAAKYAHRLCGSKMLARLTQSHSSAPSLGFCQDREKGIPSHWVWREQ